MSGSRPLPDDVTRSTGTGSLVSGSAAVSASMRPLTSSVSAEFVGPRFDAAEAPALYGSALLFGSAVAERRPQKYFGSSNDCPMSREPTVLPFWTMRLPLAWDGNAAWAMPVTR